MLNAVIRFSLRYRPVIIFLCLAALVYGTFAAQTLPVDVLPDLDRPRVVVMTEAHGYAAEDVERRITGPLERALNGSTGVESIRSQSGPSLSVIYVNFAWGTNIYVARQVVKERLDSVPLPEGVHPQLSPISSIMGQILIMGMHRRVGPNGGALASLGETRQMAELIVNTEQRKIEVYLWDPVDRGDVRRWKPLDSPDATLTFKWKEPDPLPAILTGKPAPPDAPLFVGRREAKWRTVALKKAGQVYAGTDDALKDADIEATTTVTLLKSVEGSKAPVPTAQVVTFRTALQRQMDLRTLADRIALQQLLKVTGVAQVVVMGGGRKQYQVLVDPAALVEAEATFDAVIEALNGAKNNLKISAGWGEKAGRELPILFEGELGKDPKQIIEAIGELPVKSAKGTVRMRDLVRVVEAPQLKRGDATVNGSPAVVLTVTKQPHVDTRQLTTELMAVTKEVEASLPADVEIEPDLFQMKNFIDLGLFNVAEALVIGAMLVLIILFLFLLNFRTTFISLTAIPLSLTITVLVFKLVGAISGVHLSINVMTLGGIAVAMGELVDDAIVDVENIFRRLKENHTLPNPRPVTTVIYEASVEIRSAIVFGTIMVIMVFIPVFALSSIEGRLFAPLGIAYIVSILASLVVSLTVTPVLSYYLLPQAKATHQSRDGLLLRVLKRGAAYLIRVSMSHTGAILIAGWILALLCGYLFYFHMGFSFLPAFDEGSVQVNLSLPAGSSLEQSNEMGRIADRYFQTLQKTPQNPKGFILKFVRRTGRAELDEHAEPVSNSEYILTIDPQSGRSREDVLEQLLKVRDELPKGVDVMAEQPLQHTISHMLSGASTQIVIRVFGDDLDRLEQLAGNIKEAIKDIQGITEPVVEAQQKIEELHIYPKSDVLLYYGVDREHIAAFVQTAYQGKAVTQIIDGERRIDVVVRLDTPGRPSLATLRRLMVDVPAAAGSDVPRRVELETLARVEEGRGPNAVGRDNVQRRIDVRVNTTAGRDLSSAVEEIKQRVAERVKLPDGYSLYYGGQFESQVRATRMISILVVVAVIGMFVVLLMLYPSPRIVLQILNALPMAFIGGVAALMVTGQTPTVAALVGFISLAGIAARNGILLVSHYFHLMKYEGEGFTQEMVMRGSLERLAPVLMTALTAGIALIPLVVGGHQPGREILYPVATVILGGLITSTLCEYLLHPGLFWRFSGKDAERVVQAMEIETELAKKETTPAVVAPAGHSKH